MEISYLSHIGYILTFVQLFNLQLQHFPEGKPTEQFPDPVTADPYSVKKKTPVRRPLQRRHSLEPPKKRPLFNDKETTPGYQISIILFSYTLYIMKYNMK